ncbi:phosphatase PAP2 family protein [Streptomyces sp. NRRL F-2664]|uniref:phosphatase PAP2 family protein n=1 Tax=Streptomyces sp. NRRL F-2664 TaxID=1463842 RepID=UPI0004C882F8|nr:phosphatase PAP2 family protein [Streptomyces sp. NRRL F-2664]
MTAHTTPARPPTAGPGAAARRRLIRELLLVVGFFALYKAGRLLSTDRTGEAFRNADRIWDAERLLHLPGEGAVQRLMLHGDALVTAANSYYAVVHFPATALFLIWLYVRRPAHYLWTRRVLAALTAAALVLHLAYPLAPPRMLPAARLVDTGQVYGPTVYRAAPDADTLANQFAAMPSLHFGWALMLAVGMIAATRSGKRSRWSLLWLLHPLVTLLVIVGTANHYWLDAAVAAALLGIALLLVPRPPAHDPDPQGTGGVGIGSATGTGAEAAVPPLPRRESTAEAVGAGK